MADRSPMDEPWDCVIHVEGALAPHWAAYLGGLRIAPAAAGGGTGEALTELRGELPDQAALREVVRTLHALGVPLRSVTCTPRRVATRGSRRHAACSDSAQPDQGAARGGVRDDQ